VVADCDNPIDGQAGFVSDNSPIFAISQTHDDGTGGAMSLGHFGSEWSGKVWIDAPTGVLNIFIDSAPSTLLLYIHP
jgi:hypothetical protein